MANQLLGRIFLVEELTILYQRKLLVASSGDYNFLCDKERAINKSSYVGCPLSAYIVTLRAGSKA